MRTHPQLWPLFQDKHRQPIPAQVGSRPRVAGLVPAPRVNLRRALEAAVVVEAAVAAEVVTAVETVMAADMDTVVVAVMDTVVVADMDTDSVVVMEAAPEAETAVVEATVMAISEMDMATSTGATNRTKAQGLPLR